MGTSLKVIGGALAITSLVLFGVVGVPVTETYGPNGYSSDMSWAHVIGYGTIGLIGAGLYKVGGWIDDADGQRRPSAQFEDVRYPDPNSKIDAGDMARPAPTEPVVDVAPAKCQACGGLHRPGDAFCGSCGTRLE